MTTSAGVARAQAQGLDTLVGHLGADPLPTLVLDQHLGVYGAGGDRDDAADELVARAGAHGQAPQQIEGRAGVAHDGVDAVQEAAVLDGDSAVGGDQAPALVGEARPAAAAPAGAGTRLLMASTLSQAAL